jgi:hypothetical protein
VTDAQDISGAPVEAYPANPDIDDTVTHQQLQTHLTSILSIVTANAAQTQWLCEQVTMFYQSMPPFMRKGLAANGN